MKRILFNKILVLQSLADYELHTGTKIKEDLDSYNDAFQQGLRIELINIGNKEGLFAVLVDLEKQVKLNASYPVLHIDAHGSSDHDGIILNSGEFCGWSDLKPYLIKLNIATRLNLLVVLSLCYGAHIAEHLTPQDRAPCWGLVGPTKAVNSVYLLESFSAFYREIFETADGSRAVSNLNKNVSEHDIDYYFTTADSFFKIVYKNYIKELCSIKAYDQRARKLRKRLKKDNIQNLPSIGKLRRRFKATQRDYFEKFREEFFMVDLFPENAERFNIKYSEVI